MNNTQLFLHSIHNKQNISISRQISIIIQLINSDHHLVHIIHQNTQLTPAFTIASQFQDQHSSLILQQFIKVGADMNYQDGDGRTIAFILCAQGKIKSLITISLHNNLILYHKDRLGQTPLFCAVTNNQNCIFQTNQINFPPQLINMQDDLAGHTLLFYAAAYANQELFYLLLSKGGNLFIKDYCGQNILSYTSNLSKCHQYASNLISRQNQLMNAKNLMQEEPKDQLLRLQAYQLKVLVKNKVNSLSSSEQKKILDDFKARNPKYLHLFQTHDENYDYDDYNQNWRHIAIKIVESCLHLKSGKWFANTQQIYDFEEGRQIIKNNIKLADLSMIKLKLKHHIYKRSRQFYDDMNRIWQVCQKLNNKNSMIVRYARELRKYFFDKMDQYDFFPKYLTQS